MGNNSSNAAVCWWVHDRNISISLYLQKSCCCSARHYQVVSVRALFRTTAFRQHGELRCPAIDKSISKEVDEGFFHPFLLLTVMCCKYISCFEISIQGGVLSWVVQDNY